MPIYHLKESKLLPEKILTAVWGRGVRFVVFEACV